MDNSAGERSFWDNEREAYCDIDKSKYLRKKIRRIILLLLFEITMVLAFWAKLNGGMWML